MSTAILLIYIKTSSRELEYIYGWLLCLTLNMSILQGMWLNWNWFSRELNEQNPAEMLKMNAMKWNELKWTELSWIEHKKLPNRF